MKLKMVGGGMSNVAKARTQSDLYEEVFEAVMSGDVEALASSISSGDFEKWTNPPNIDVSNKILSFAAKNGRFDCVKLLLSSRVANPEGISEALSAAASWGHEACVDILMGACSKYYLDEAWALASAAEGGHVECARRLAHVSNPKARSSAALLAAAEKGHIECVELLIPASDPSADNSRALSYAALGGHASCVRLLIPKSNPKALCSEALSWASFNGHDECVRLLAPVSDLSANNFGALSNAACSGSIESVKLLLAGAPAKAVEQSIISAIRNRREAVVFHLLSAEESRFCNLEPALILAKALRQESIEEGVLAFIERRSLESAVSQKAGAASSMRL